MACQALWNTISDESFHSDVLSEIDFIYSTKELENKDTECICCNGKFFEDEREEIWIYFSYSQWGHLDFAGAENAEYVCDFYKQTRSRSGFCIILKI